MSLAKHAELPAIEGRHTLHSYRELDRQSAALARALAGAGVRAGDVVPLLLRRSPALVVAQVAVLRLGAAYAPIDLASPVVRREAMLDLIKPRVVLTDGSTILRGSQDYVQLNINDVEPLSANDAPAAWCIREPGALAYVMFTSGTSGMPKGVMVPQSGITRLVCDADFAEFRVGARWGFLSSPAFDAATLEVWAPLLNGGCCVVQEEVHPSLDDLATILLSSRITDAWLTSALFNALVEDRPDSFARLRQLLIGGERLSQQHVRTVLTSYPHLRLINGYGPTENTTFTLCHTITLADADNANGIPIGTPIHGTVVRIGTDAAEPAEGELLAGGAGVSLGYLGDQALTDTKFVVVGGKRWYRTGDRVTRRGDGIFEFLGRIDRQVKLQGHRVELDGVERALASCPGVGQAAVMVRGESAESRHLVAWYSGLGGAPPDAEQVAALLAARLLPAAVPRVLHPMAHLPLTSSGKVDYAALEQLAQTAEAGSPGLEADWQTDTERLLAEIWRKHFPASHIDRSTSFLAIGGTSLVALQVSAQVRRQAGRDLTPIDVLRTPVLAEQARRIDASPPFEADALSDVPAEAQLPLTRIQRAMLAGTQLDSSGSAYLVHVALNIAGAISHRAVRRAFETLAARHPSLRLAVHVGGNPAHGRVNQRLPDGWWREYDVIGQVPADLAWPPDLLSVINRPLDLWRDGVMRVDLWPVAGGSTLLVWTVHHISVDEASVDRCLMELDRLLAGANLQPAYGSPLGFAQLEKAWTDHDAVREWSNRFVELLGTEPPRLPRAPGPGREVPLPIPAELSRALDDASARWGITPFAPLLVAYGMALQEVFGAACRVVTTPFSRRVEPELIEPVGCLLDLAFVEAGTRPGESVAEALARVRDAVVKLQRPSFVPHAAIAELVAMRDPTLVRQLNGCAFTWRLDPARTTGFGAQQARVLRAPQRGARFGLSVHAWQEQGELRCSVEAIEAAFVDGRAAALGEAFVRQLGAVCGVEELPASQTVASEQSTSDSPTVDAELAARLRAAWSHWVGVPAGEIVDATDFLACGGNSLTVMRMAAQLRREHGITVEPGTFLARPTFRNLCALAGEPMTESPSCSVVVGPPDAANVVLLIPGFEGLTLGLYTLADHIQRRMGSNHAVIIADLQAMLLHAPIFQPLAFLSDRTEQLLKEIGAERVVGIVGSSMGGLFGLLLARRFPTDGCPPFWLLDTYRLDPLASLLRRVVRSSAVSLLRSPKVARFANKYFPGSDAARHRPPVSTIDFIWEAVRFDLSREPAEARRTEVHLVQATQTMSNVKFLWRRSNNGFNPKRFGFWYIHQLKAGHGDLSRALAPETARLISSRLRDPTSIKARL